MSSSPNQYHIDLDQLAEILNVGIRRSVVFLGLGVNAAQDDRMSDYSLSKQSMLRIAPEGLPRETVVDYKRHFEDWNVNNALRDLIESFDVFLDSMHLICLRLNLISRSLAAADFAKARSKFEHKGCDEKLTDLMTRYNIGTSKSDYFTAIKQVRNCITHRRGIVGTKDVGQDGKLHLTWWRMRLFLKGESGQEVDMEYPFPEHGYTLEEAGHVCLQVRDRQRELSLGEAVKFTAAEVLEICHLAQVASGELISSLIGYLKGQGVAVADSPKPPETTP
jgi:hypothetical protein